MGIPRHNTGIPRHTIGVPMRTYHCCTEVGDVKKALGLRLGLRLGLGLVLRCTSGGPWATPGNLIALRASAPEHCQGHCSRRSGQKHPRDGVCEELLMEGTESQKQSPSILGEQVVGEKEWWQLQGFNKTCSFFLF